MNELGWLLMALASTIVATNVALVVVARVLYKRIRRNLSVNGTLLRFQARLSFGPRRQVLRLRVQLKQTLDSGAAAMDLEVRSDAPHGELPRLFRRITSEGMRLDAQLRLLESETDAGVLAEGVREARQRLDQLADLVRRLRKVVGFGIGGLPDESLATLRTDVDREITAVRAGIQELHELNTRGAHT